MSIATIGLFGNPAKPQIGEAIETVRAVIADRPIEILLPLHLAQYDGDGLEVVQDSELAERADVIIAFGGDGTMLRAARHIGRLGTPLLGINLGSLGYLTDVPLPELPAAIESLLDGHYHLAERQRIKGSIRRSGEDKKEYRALNDIVINMGPLPRALDMEIKLDRVTLGRYLGDGLIVSTATGSTAYNLSAGGPIVHPGVGGYLVTPICPHSLAVRPIIVPEPMRVELKLHDVGQGATLTADGQAATTLNNGDRVVFSISGIPVQLVKFPHSDFFRAMRRKLQWGAIKRRRGRD